MDYDIPIIIITMYSHKKWYNENNQKIKNHLRNNNHKETRNIQETIKLLEKIKLNHEAGL
jgi:uncharacterized SAM-dependent methyltransferase